MHHRPCLGPPDPGGRVQGWNHAKNLSAIKIYSYAKFHQDRYYNLDFYKVWYIVLYILDKFSFKMYTNDTSQEPSFVCLNANQEKSTY